MISSLGSVRGIVFVMMAGAVIALTFLKIVDAKDFLVLAGMAFTAYFSRGRDSTLPPTA